MIIDVIAYISEWAVFFHLSFNFKFENAHRYFQMQYWFLSEMSLHLASDNYMHINWMGSK